jgi:hypothetical protein
MGEETLTIADALDKWADEGCPPTIDAEPVRHGRWVKCQGKSNIWYCSECGEKINYKQNRRTYNIPKVAVWEKNKRCRNCSAKMDGGADAT